MKKLTPTLIARIKAQKAKGATFDDLKREFGVSIGSVANALKSADAPSRPRKATPASAPSPAASEGRLLTPDDLRRDLAAQVRALRTEIEGAESPSLRASLNRVLVSAQQLLARVTPPDPNVAPQGMTLVSTADMKEQGLSGEQRLSRLAAELKADQETWPKCRACGQAIPPADLEERVARFAAK